MLHLSLDCKPAPRRCLGPMVAKANPLDAIENQVRATGTDPEALNTAAVNAVRQLLSGDGSNADEARQQAAQALAQALIFELTAPREGGLPPPREALRLVFL